MLQRFGHAPSLAPGGPARCGHAALGRSSLVSYRREIFHLAAAPEPLLHCAGGTRRRPGGAGWPWWLGGRRGRVLGGRRHRRRSRVRRAAPERQRQRAEDGGRAPRAGDERDLIWGILGAMNETLFAHLATKFGPHPENLATEALGYILRRSLPAREAVRDLLGKVGAVAPSSLIYQNQVAGGDEAQPDLVGFDDKGDQRLIIEAKFWAGLTSHQPVTYLERLPRDGGTLVFVVPAARVMLIWGELLRRCQDAELSVQESQTGIPDVRQGALVDGRRLVLVSWRALLDPIGFRLEAADDRRAREDVAQLRGLCERMDAEAFLPVTSEELTTQIYRRVIEFGRLVDEVCTALRHQGIANMNGLRAIAGNGYSGRYLRLRGVGCFLVCDIRKWMKFAPTPLWLSVYGVRWEKSDASTARRALAPLESVTPPRMFMAGDGFPTVALQVPVGAERDTVVKNLLDQVIVVADLLAPLGSVEQPAGGAKDTPPDDAPPEA
ncbi:hypothetical protein WMF28_24140 [Sorangium sp. So ce590]|uniref:hypothetical protein n=1 Tax=Sorangium sp. So ce590 TaxID=3133317 RepID=UPI003F640703